jgi:hypothetical protein
VQRYPEVKKKRFVLEFKTSGLSAAAFCRRHPFSPVTLAAWRRRYPASAPEPASSPGVSSERWLSVALIPENASPSTTVGPYLLSTGPCSLSIPSGFDASEVRQLWELIQSTTPRP